MPVVYCNRKVEDHILRILRERRLDCLFWHQYEEDQAKYCKKQIDDYFTAETNWFTKCKQFYLFTVAHSESLSCCVRRKCCNV